MIRRYPMALLVAGLTLGGTGLIASTASAASHPQHDTIAVVSEATSVVNAVDEQGDANQSTVAAGDSQTAENDSNTQDHNAEVQEGNIGANETSTANDAVDKANDSQLQTGDSQVQTGDAPAQIGNADSGQSGAHG